MNDKDYSLCIYHHGIKGQKWGVRRFDKKPKAKKQRTKEEIEARKRKRRAALGIATIVALRTLPYFILKYEEGKAYVEANNAAVDVYAKVHGLNEVKGRATLGIKHIKAGKEIVSRIFGG